MSDAILLKKGFRCGSVTGSLDGNDFEADTLSVKVVLIGLLLLYYGRLGKWYKFDLNSSVELIADISSISLLL